MTMSKIMSRVALVVLGFLAAGAWGQEPGPYDQPARDDEYQRDDQGYTPRLLVALQDDLRLLDDSLAALSRRHPRSREFELRADDIRRDVAALAERARINERLGRSGRAEVTALRGTVAALRDDVEEALSQGRPRRTGLLRIPPGTEIEVMLNEPVSSRSANPEDRISASTVSALRFEGRTVIPAGATVLGSVREVRSRRRGQSDGWLMLDFDHLAPEGGPAVEMRSHVVSIPEMPLSNKALRNGGLGALLGGVVGGIIDGKKGIAIGAAVGAGGGLLASQGSDLDLPEGTLLVLRLDAPLTVARRRY